MGDKEHHVHRSSSTDRSKINVEPSRHGFINVNLGFLKIHQRYQVDFLILWSGCWQQKDDSSAPAVPFGEQNPYCRIMEFVQDKDDSLRLKVELYVNDETLLKEQLLISCCNSRSPLIIFIRARVLGETDGPPILRDGVRRLFEWRT